jgi:hypothetical protein
MTVLCFSRESEANAKVRSLTASLRYFEVFSATQKKNAPTLMQCQSLVSRALGFARWPDLVESLHMLPSYAYRSHNSYRYIDKATHPEAELENLLQKLQHAIDLNVDKDALRLAVTGVGFGYSPGWNSVSIEVLKPMLNSGLTRSQFSGLTHLNSGLSFATRYTVSPETYSEIRHTYEVKKAEILGHPRPRKRKYRQF